MLLIKHIGAFPVLLLYVFIIACSENSLSAEDEIKQYIAMAQQAAEERNHNDLSDLT